MPLHVSGAKLGAQQAIEEGSNVEIVGLGALSARHWGH